MQWQSCVSSFALNSEVEVLFSTSVHLSSAKCRSPISHSVRPKNCRGGLNDLFPIRCRFLFIKICSYSSYSHIRFPHCDRQKSYLMYKYLCRVPLSRQGKVLYRRCLSRIDPSVKERSSKPSHWSGPIPIIEETLVKNKSAPHIEFYTASK